ncbi:MAG: hypothetical protein KF693_11650 [Nitrospira sp.]|nr:hypothetical protein [Nitrospira sp.]
MAEKAIRDEEDQLRTLLNPDEAELRQTVRLTPLDAPITYMEILSLEEAIETAITQRPEITQAKKSVVSARLCVDGDAARRAGGRKGLTETKSAM